MVNPPKGSMPPPEEEPKNCKGGFVFTNLEFLDHLAAHLVR
jgi:hypothetical protein